LGIRKEEMKKEYKMQEVKFFGMAKNGSMPHSKKAMYVDSTAGDEFRENVDVELSHWRPNKTEDKYKGGTSTEICFNYLRLNPTIDYDLVINNHLDVDGVLSAFVLTHPTIALKYQRVLINAAKAGDFWAWADGKSLKVFQMLTLFFEKCLAAELSVQESYRRCFTLILRLLQSKNDRTQAEKILMGQFAFVERGAIIREVLNPRVVSYHVPQSVSHKETHKYLEAPKFNEPISHRLSLWPQVRNRLDEEKLHLVSTEVEKGTHFELWLPGYCWADTKGLWRPAGISALKNIGDVSQIQWDALKEIVGGFYAQDKGACRWNLFTSFSFANSKNPRPFPIIMTTMDVENPSAASQLPLDKIKKAFRSLE
jgi:hypothetical protein